MRSNPRCALEYVSRFVETGARVQQALDVHVVVVPNFDFEKAARVGVARVLGFLIGSTVEFGSTSYNGKKKPRAKEPRGSSSVTADKEKRRHRPTMTVHHDAHAYPIRRRGASISISLGA